METEEGSRFDIAILAAALWLRRWSPHSQVLPFVMTQFYCIGFALAAYVLGHYTSPFGGIVGLAGAVTAMMLFERRMALSAIRSFVLIVTATTIGEQLGVLPYAPVFRAAPYAGGHLPTDFLIYIGAPMFGIFVVAIVLCYYILDRRRDRDEKLALASEQLARANDIISRYVASQLADQVRKGDYAGVDGHHRRKLTLFFSDIQSFATVADEVEPEDLSTVLNEYLTEMTAIGERYGATIDKFVGDAIMIFFGAPNATNDRDQALRAVRMAVEMQERMRDLRQQWTREGLERPFRIRIGINTGQATIGSFGSPGRMDYTAIGRQVNLAARLQVHCEAGRILISHSTWALVQDDISCTPKGDIQVKGFLRPVRVYEVTAVSDEPVTVPREA
jgi:adenylate cyclase